MAKTSPALAPKNNIDILEKRLFLSTDKQLLTTYLLFQTAS